MRAAAAALVCSFALSGCAYQVRQAGDDRFLSTLFEWAPGTTTVGDVVDAFGPPDAIRWSAGRLLFVYRAERRAASTFVLSYYLKIFSAEIGGQQDGTLIVAFDDRDRLLYYGRSAEPREDLAGDLGVR